MWYIYICVCVCVCVIITKVSWLNRSKLLTKKHESEQKRTALFWVITQWVMVIFYRRFGTTYRARIQISIILLDSWLLNMGPIGCLETSVRNYHYSLRNDPEVRSSLLLRGGSLKSRNKGGRFKVNIIKPDRSAFNPSFWKSSFLRAHTCNI